MGWGVRGADRRPLGREAQIHLPGSEVDTPGYYRRRPSDLAPRPFLAVFPGSHPARP